VLIGTLSACNSGDSSSSSTTASASAGSLKPTEFASMSKAAAGSLTAAIAKGATKIVGVCPYQDVFAQFLDFGVNAEVGAANLNVNSVQTGGVDLVCETPNAQIAVGTYDPKVLTAETLANEATSVTTTAYGSIYVFPKYIFKQPDTYVQYAWLLTPDLYIGVAVPPPLTVQPLVDRLAAVASTLAALTVTVKVGDFA
jgi:hypothetical protein